MQVEQQIKRGTCRGCVCLPAWMLILVFLFPSGIVMGQYYNLTFRNYMNHNGIAQSEVEAIFEDSRGFLWIGTHFGLSRFDGREFRNFYHHVDDAASMGDNEISAIDEDSSGTLWISFFNSGFASLDARSARFMNYQQTGPAQLASLAVTTLMVDRINRVWLGTVRGLSIYTPSSGRFQQVADPKTGQRFDVLCLSEDATGRVWMGTRNQGLWMIDPGTGNMRQCATADQTGEVRALDLVGSNGAYAACSEGLFQVRRVAVDDFQCTRAAFFPQRESLVDVEVDAQQNIWFGSAVNGVYIYFPKTGFLDHLQENFSSARGLLSNRMFELYQDSQDGIWLGGENGLQYYQYQAQKFNIYPGLSNVSDQLRGSTLYGIVEVDNDLIMASSGGVLIYNRVTNQYSAVRYPPDYRPGSVRFRSLEWEGPMEWWLSTDHGMYRMRQIEGQYVIDRPPQLQHIPAFRAWNVRRYLRKGDTYFFALALDGLVVWNLKTGYLKHYRTPEGLPSNVINQLEFDRDGNILLGHNAGLSVFRPADSSFRHIRQRPGPGKEGLNSPFVYDMHDDGRYYWVATFGGGLNKVDKITGQTEHFTTRQGLCNDGIYSMVAEDSVIWLGTAKGLSRFDKQSASFESFSLEDGLPSLEFNMLSRYSSREGEIFMGTMFGLVSFSTKDIRKYNIPPRIYLSRVRSNGIRLPDSSISEINTSRRLVTNYGQSVYMEFSAQVFAGSDDLDIRYRLNKIDTTWRTGESGSLVPLIRTEPGTYTLVVQIIRRGGLEKSPEWRMEFVVQPQFWQTPPFRILIGILGAFLLYGLISSYIRRRLQVQQAGFEREKAVEKERSRISAELHDDIGGGLTAIRLMSEMLVDSSTEDRSRSYAARISSSANDLVQKMNEIVWALNLSNDNLQSLVAYTREFAVSYLDDFDLRCRIDIPDAIPDMPVTGRNRRDIFLLVKESLNNIVKHANATEVQLGMRFGRELHVSIRDNGKGFDPSSVRRGANGLNNMRKRVKRLRARMDIRSNEGTSVQFDIPLAALGQSAID
jgi:signal transduction histidine kinase/streptogramin lyase